MALQIVITSISLCMIVLECSTHHQVTAGAPIACYPRTRNQNFLSAIHKELRHVPYRQTVTRSHVLCVSYCHADPLCQSVNYNMDSRLCELNNKTRARCPNGLVTRYGSAYFDADLDTFLFSQPTDQSEDVHPNPSSSLTSLPRQRDCEELRQAGYNASGIYTITPTGFDSGLKVYCNMDTDDGAWWIVIQRRQDGSVDFFRNWTEYEVGFGSLANEFWLGNDNLRALTDGSGSWRLMVNLEGEQNKTAFAEYGQFRISGDNFTLHLDSYSVESTAGDSLYISHNGKMFTTKDRDNDWKPDANCAATTAGAWWYKSCYNSNLNGLFHADQRVRGMRWSSWNDNIPVKKCTMKIRLNT
ncbi:ficolin-3-like [Asterias rubens]|uniref:ficolin-3-like n=1 Tax=Asterias rubens TaxID=7604 RepID=UPI00145556F8|nr:ficolin-3-like [Asterias rubens]